MNHKSTYDKPKHILCVVLLILIVYNIYDYLTIRSNCVVENYKYNYNEVSKSRKNRPDIDHKEIEEMEEEEMDSDIENVSILDYAITDTIFDTTHSLMKSNRPFINRPTPKIISFNSPSKKLFNKDKFIDHLISNNLLIKNKLTDKIDMPENDGEKRKLLYDSYIDFIKPLFPISEFNNVGDLSNDRTIVFFDSRIEVAEQIVFLCSVFTKLLGPSWAVQIIGTKEVIEHIKKLFPKVVRSQIQYITVDNFDFKSYSKMALDATILKQIPQENQLWIQTDSFIHRYSDFNEWTKYDFLGAPWKICPANEFSSDPYEPICYYGGSGGTSFRKRSVMLKLLDLKRSCCENFKNCESNNVLTPYECHLSFRGQNALFEDLFLINEMKMIGIEKFKIANFKKRIDFCFESIPSKSPFLSHKIWVYANYREIYDALLNTDF